MFNSTVTKEGGLLAVEAVTICLAGGLKGPDVAAVADVPVLVSNTDPSCM